MDGSTPIVDRLVCGRRELEGWRVVCQLNALAYPALDFQTHLAPAFAYGLFARQAWRDSVWNAELDSELGQEWLLHRSRSALSWSQARALARQGFEGFRGPRAAAAMATRPSSRAARAGGRWMAWLARWLVPGRGMRVAG